MKIGLRTFKTAIGATFSILIAEMLQLDYAVSAGLIAILSIQNTKKSSFELAIQRLLSGGLALSIAVIAFLMLGFNAFSFGLFLLVFIPLSVKLNLSSGIMVSSVLVTHLLVEKTLSFYWFKNEILLLVIGAGIGIFLNLYMPKLEEKLKDEQKRIEIAMKQILFFAAQSLKDVPPSLNDENRFLELKIALQSMQEKASRHLANTFVEESRYYLQYVQMRFVQYRILKQMYESLARFKTITKQAKQVALLTEKTALQLEENNPAQNLALEADHLLKSFQESDLPKTRAEFESRAILFQFVSDLRYLIEIKRDFYSQVVGKEKEN